MKDLGEIHHILGIEIKRDKNGISMSQKSYIRELLKRFGMEDAKVASTPMEVG